MSHLFLSFLLSVFFFGGVIGDSAQKSKRWFMSGKMCSFVCGIPEVIEESLEVLMGQNCSQRFLSRVCGVLDKCRQVGTRDHLPRQIEYVLSDICATPLINAHMALCAVGYTDGNLTPYFSAEAALLFLHRFFWYTINRWVNWHEQAIHYFTVELRCLGDAKSICLLGQGSRLGRILRECSIDSRSLGTNLGIDKHNRGEARIVATVMLLCAIAMSAARKPQDLPYSVEKLLGAAKPLEHASEVADPELVNKWFSLFVEVTLTAVDPPGQCSAAKAEAIVALLGCSGNPAITAKYVVYCLKAARVEHTLEVLKQAINEERCTALDIANEFLFAHTQYNVGATQSVATFLVHAAFDMTAAHGFGDCEDKLKPLLRHPVIAVQVPSVLVKMFLNIQQMPSNSIEKQRQVSHWVQFVDAAGWNLKKQDWETMCKADTSLAHSNAADRIPKSTLERCCAKDPSLIKALEDTTLMQCECQMMTALLRSLKTIPKAATTLIENASAEVESECASNDVTMHQMRVTLATLSSMNGNSICDALDKAELQSAMRAIAKINFEMKRVDPARTTPPGIVSVSKRAAAPSSGDPVRFQVVVREYANPQHARIFNETDLYANTTIADFVQCTAFTKEFVWGDDTILTLDGVEIPIHSGVLLEHLCDGAGILELALCRRCDMALRIAVSLDEATRAIVRGNAPSAFEEPPCLRDPKIYLWAHESVRPVEVEAALLHIVSSQCALTQSSARECLQVTQKSQRRYVISMQPKVPVQLVPVYFVDEAVVLVPTIRLPAVPSHDDLLHIARAACHRLQFSIGLWCECRFVTKQDEAPHSHEGLLAAK